MAAEHTIHTDHLRKIRSNRCRLAVFMVSFVVTGV